MCHSYGGKCKKIQSQKFLGLSRKEKVFSFKWGLFCESQIVWRKQTKKIHSSLKVIWNHSSLPMALMRTVFCLWQDAFKSRGWILVILVGAFQLWIFYDSEGPRRNHSNLWSSHKLGMVKATSLPSVHWEKMNSQRKCAEEAQVELNLLNDLLNIPVQIYREGLFAFCLNLAEVLLNWDPGLLTQKCWLAPYLHFPICRMSNNTFTSGSYLHQVSH